MLSGTAAIDQKRTYVTTFEDGKVDAYVRYCTNAANTLRALPQLTVVHIPDGMRILHA